MQFHLMGPGDGAPFNAVMFPAGPPGIGLLHPMHMHLMPAGPLGLEVDGEEEVPHLMSDVESDAEEEEGYHTADSNAETEVLLGGEHEEGVEAGLSNPPAGQSSRPSRGASPSAPPHRYSSCSPSAKKRKLD